MKDDFVWGVAASSFQTEGAAFADGKGESIWDVFSKKKNKIQGGDTADTACNFYNVYEYDIQLMQEMHIRNFRFSISWPRILPDGYGKINFKGIDFYDRLIDSCLDHEITPWITAYHWDLPNALELKGGWTNRDIISWFEEYIVLLADKFGDRVKHWMVLNEPVVFTGAGYFLGVHAPGRRGLNNFLPAVHHTAMSQANGIRILKDLIPDAEVGTTFSCSYFTPNTNTLQDRLAAERTDALLNKLFIEPLLGLGYPVIKLPFLKEIEKYMKPGDAKALEAIPDFVGIQNYTREVIKYSPLTPYLNAKLISASKRQVKHTVMNWEVYPESLYHMLMKFNKYKMIKKLLVTENGAAFQDIVHNDQVYDPERVKFLQACIGQMNRAKNDGAKVHGYFIWSFTDNFEWTEGYNPRFGIVHVDFKTQKRTVKASGRWYSTLLSKEKEEICSGYFY